ncbi:hypothetical protein PoB_003248500 [Plakobranchus ocellatus]|uniref:Uncharacterized protein n=1 Tax=Plakobranchus ocellatus TaxID=259542 RepID=A0AAV4ACT9_9GAST|nr:hypothetical protein PoB_003248500 [Plakobranchus ocellatus]
MSKWYFRCIRVIEAKDANHLFRHSVSSTHLENWVQRNIKTTLPFLSLYSSTVIRGQMDNFTLADMEYRCTLGRLDSFREIAQGAFERFKTLNCSSDKYLPLIRLDLLGMYSEHDKGSFFSPNNGNGE